LGLCTFRSTTMSGHWEVLFSSDRTAAHASVGEEE
jgi:hypothetical protein